MISKVTGSMWTKKNKKAIAILLLCVLSLQGCSGANLKQNTAQDTADQETGFLPDAGRNYDSADTAVLVKKNAQEETMTFFNMPTGKNYTLNYDGTTIIQDKYGTAMSAEQMNPGDILDVTFLKSKKKLNSATLSSEAWNLQVSGNFEINQNGHGMLIGEEQYKLADHVMVVAENKQADLMDINSCDKLIVKGTDRTIHSVTIEKGHGYLRLENDEYFIDGWIEVGNVLIQPVKEDMLLTVPEGSYRVLVSQKGQAGSKDIVIARNAEVTLDVGDLKGEEIALGQVLFTAEPEETSIYVDGDKIDAAKPVELEYGVHQLIARAEGYDTVTRYFKVGQPYATLDVELELTAEGEGETAVSGNDILPSTLSGNGVSGNGSVSPSDAQSANAVGSYRIHITSPEGAEVYFDGNYMGLAPADFKKEAGSHVITLRKSGYQTRSFTIQVDDEKKDISWAFSELETMR